MSEKDNSAPLFSPFEIERQARIRRSLVIQSYVRGTMRAFAEWLRTFVLRSTQLTRGLAAQRRIYSDIRELQQFDDRMLADIGITTDRGAQFDDQIAVVNAQILSRAGLLASVPDLCGSRPQARHTDRSTRRGPGRSARNLGASLLHCGGSAQDLQSGAGRIGDQAL
jgi:Domain of unknown function (DUF1127)